MKTKYYLLAILAVLLAFLAGVSVGKEQIGPITCEVTETVETKADTTTYHAPKPQTTTSLGTRSYVFPKYVVIGGRSGGESRQCETDSTKRESVADVVLESGNDSGVIELPMVHRHYADSAFEAWVSGPIDPRLDSVRVHTPTTIITRREWKPPKRWHMGPAIGCGLTSNGFETYIGFSLTYSIISW